MKNVAVIGASNKEERYSNLAMKMLEQYGYRPIPVTPLTDTVCGHPTRASITDITESVDTDTLYISPRQQENLAGQLVRLKPRRVIFNPGTENPAMYGILETAGIEVIEACTLVMLRTGQF